jgi:hypothetical protein
MSTIAWLIIGAVGASVLWLFAIAFLLDVIGAQRTQLDRALTAQRFIRDSRDESDRQVRALLTQNERLARQLIDRAADSTTTPVITVPSSVFHTTRES